MATGTRYYTPNAFEPDANGVPIVGAQLFFYVTDTSTPQSTYSDAALTIPNTNPVVSDSSGHFGSIFLSGSQAYKIVCYGPNPNPANPSTPANPQGVQLWTEDPCGPAAGGNQAVAGIIGETRAFCGVASAIPAGWYLCYGQAVSRATYASAFAVLGTTWGEGDGNTTFNLPDLRGRVLVGLDNMGGVPANLITSGVCGVPGTTLGGTGGDQHTQRDTFTATSAVTDPGHFHTVTHPGGDGTTAGGNNSWSGGTSNVDDTSTVETGISVETEVTGEFIGEAQNVQPSAMVNLIIYLGA